jgi:glutaryl-CoA dehydrogenase
MNLDVELGTALGTDFLHLRDDIGDHELDYLERTRDFVQNEVQPVIAGLWERAEFPWDLVRRMGELGLVGDGIQGYGCPDMSHRRQASSLWNSVASTAV